MNVLIVDDEMIERKAMRRFIEESFSRIKVVGEAANGRRAIEEAKRHTPDVIIMDIRMPGIDGLAAIRRILLDLPRTRFIILSAYDSFEYAKEAMKHGVKEYILKPSNKQETLEALMRIEKELNEEKRLAELTTKQQMETVKLVNQQIITSIIQNEMTMETTYLYKKQFPQANLAFFQVYTPIDQVENLLTNKAPFPYIQKEVGDKLVVLFITDKKSAHHVKADALIFARTMSGHLPETTIGIGNPYAELSKLSVSYQQALLASTQLTMNANVSYGYPITKEANEDETKAKLEKSLINEIRAGRLEQANDYFELYYDHLKKKAEEKNLDHLLKEGGIRLKQQLEHHGLYIDDHKLLDPTTKEDFQNIIKQYCEKVILQKEEHNAVIMAKKYIQIHYKESISLEDVAEYVRLTPTYFTKMFKEHTKKTFIDYVTEYRIEKAKELLLNTKLSLKEISYEIGYKDPNYFSRVFKKWTNVSPKQYRSLDMTTTK